MPRDTPCTHVPASCGVLRCQERRSRSGHTVARTRTRVRARAFRRLDTGVPYVRARSERGTTERAAAARAAGFTLRASDATANKRRRRLSASDPQTSVVPGVTRGRNVRSNSPCSMCPAIHINSRSWLRSSSTHEPSDPPPRVIIFNSSFPFQIRSGDTRRGELPGSSWTMRFER